MSWAHPQTGQNGLHVATDGRVAALLLLSGHTGIEQRELTKGMTPIVFNTYNANVRVVATLLTWGTEETKRDAKIGANSDDHAHWLSYPKVEGSDTCLEILRRTHDVAQYTGVQWLHSQKIIDELKLAGIKTIVHDSVEPGALHDHVLVSPLPQNLQHAARLFDVDNSGSVSLEELFKCDAEYIQKNFGVTFQHDHGNYKIMNGKPQEFTMPHQAL